MLEIVRGARGISPSVIGSKRRVRIEIRFPRAITFVADFPVAETVMISNIRMAHPSRRFGSGSGTVVHGDKGLSADIGGDVDKVGK